MTRLEQLNQQGQSIWYDNIHRSLIDSGELAGLIDNGITGVTSNPAIFKQAIVDGSDYDPAILLLTAADQSPKHIYETLALEDIRRTADLLRPIYDRTQSVDGYVSLEVNPALAHDTAGTVVEARRLRQLVDRPNLMIKVPATPAGIPALKQLISEGINVNVTLIFGLPVYAAVVEAYTAGLEALADKGSDLSQVTSVASFFVSRVDTAVDSALAEIGNASLQGRIAIANAKVAYSLFKYHCSQTRWQNLSRQGAKVQRLLWASTGTKNPQYPDTLYVDELIGADTINTVPPATLSAFMNNGKVDPTLGVGLDEAKDQLAQLADLGIAMERVTRELLHEGVAAFAKAFEALLTGIGQKQDQFNAKSS